MFLVLLKLLSVTQLGAHSSMRFLVRMLLTIKINWCLDAK